MPYTTRTKINREGIRVCFYCEERYCEGQKGICPMLCECCGGELDLEGNCSSYCLIEYRNNGVYYCDSCDKIIEKS